MPFNFIRHLYAWPVPDAELGAGATTGAGAVAAQYLEKSGEVEAGGGQVPDAAQVSSLHCMMSSSQSKAKPKLLIWGENCAINSFIALVMAQLQQQQCVSSAMHEANMFLKYAHGLPAARISWAMAICVAGLFNFAPRINNSVVHLLCTGLHWSGIAMDGGGT